VLLPKIQRFLKYPCLSCNALGMLMITEGKTPSNLCPPCPDRLGLRSSVSSPDGTEDIFMIVHVTVYATVEAIQGSLL